MAASALHAIVSILGADTKPLGEIFMPTSRKALEDMQLCEVNSLPFRRQASLASMEKEKMETEQIARPGGDSTPTQEALSSSNTADPHKEARGLQSPQQLQSSVPSASAADSSSIVPAKWDDHGPNYDLLAGSVKASSTARKPPEGEEAAPNTQQEVETLQHADAKRGEASPRIPFGLASAGGSGMDFFDGAPMSIGNNTDIQVCLQSAALSQLLLGIEAVPEHETALRFIKRPSDGRD